MKEETDAWRPIDTAPKDGTRIDVWVEIRQVLKFRGKGVLHVGYRETDAWWGMPDNRESPEWCRDGEPIVEPIEEKRVFGNDPESSYRAEVTHWMPKPAPPANRIFPKPSRDSHTDRNET